ncbi:MAG: hypothetical protein K2X86_14420 [Cytophagaceae bacterium]|nr:hypothetical protein [Cytophagaceae bacterium]
MDRFADDKAKLYDIVRSIEEAEAIIGGMRFETFVKQNHVIDGITYHLREIGVAARLLSDEFKEAYGDIDWNVLTNLQFATWDQEIEIDPHALWYVIENDLPRIKDQIFDITAVLEDKEDQFYF